MQHFPYGDFRQCHIALRLPLVVVLCCPLFFGCAALTNPVADGVPVRRLPPELLAPSKSADQTIPLNLLGQAPDNIYRLAAGDVLGVYVDGFLGDRNLAMPVFVNQPVQIKDQRRLTPGAGYPVTVQADGTIVLPSVPPLKVAGLTLNEARDAIRNLYVEKHKAFAQNDRVFVTLMQARQCEIVVMRQETQTLVAGPDGLLPGSKRGNGYVVDLPGRENDVLHALAQTGGLPGLDAYNEIIIQRNAFRDAPDREALQNRLGAVPARGDPLKTLGVCGQTIRIPLRLPPGTGLPFSPDDVVLHSGDVVFLEAREDQWYYTGGLLPPGKHLLPRDRDLDVIEAITEVHGPLINGAFGGSNLSGALIDSGIGNPSPTLLTVVRRMPGGGQVPIKIDLRRALNDSRERIALLPGDLLILQEKPTEALARYFSQTFLNFEMFWRVFSTSTSAGVLDIAAPNRLATPQQTFTVP